MAYQQKTPGRRIGLIVPSSNTVMEPDFYLNLPDGWTLHTARMFLDDVTPETEARMLDEFTFPAALDLVTVRPDVVVFGCTSAGALRGNEYEEQLIAEIGQITHCPVVSVNKSVRQTIQGIGAKRLVVITPYIEKLNMRIRDSLEKEGMQVLNIQGLGIVENTSIASVTGEEIIALARQTVGSLDPDALFVSCTNFPAVRILKDLRTAFPFPVVSSNQASLEKAIEVIMHPA
jgi:maleate isomerase